MFDNTMFIEPPPATPRRFGPAAAGLLAVLAVLAAMPRAGAVYAAPTQLRQIVVRQAAGAGTDFYLSEAGFRSRRAGRLLARAKGGGDVSVTWLGPDGVRLDLTGWSGIETRNVPGVEIATRK